MCRSTQLLSVRSSDLQKYLHFKVTGIGEQSQKTGDESKTFTFAHPNFWMVLGTQMLISSIDHDIDKRECFSAYHMCRRPTGNCCAPTCELWAAGADMRHFSPSRGILGDGFGTLALQFNHSQNGGLVELDDL